MLHKDRLLALAFALALASPAAAQQTAAPTEPTAPAATAEPAETAPAAEQPAEQPAAEAFASPPAEAPAQQTPTDQTGQQLEIAATHGAWQIVCRVGGTPCAMRQIGATAEGQQAMEVSIRKVEPQQTQQGTVESVIDVRVPLGVLLREGLSIQIDSSAPQKGAFGICLRDGCILREPLPNSMISAMKKGAVATMTFAMPAGPVPVTISLSGFTAAINALAKAN